MALHLFFFNKGFIKTRRVVCFYEMDEPITLTKIQPEDVEKLVLKEGETLATLYMRPYVLDASEDLFAARNRALVASGYPVLSKALVRPLPQPMQLSNREELQLS